MEVASRDFSFICGLKVEGVQWLDGGTVASGYATIHL